MVDDGRPIAHLSRRYHFSASHRLHTEVFDAERNRAIYGKCNNPFGHGHNYTVQITLRGPIDPLTGMVCDLGGLDAFAHENLIECFDHTNLNTLACFAETVSTTENLAIEVQRRFRGFTAATLVGVRVEETSNNSFDLLCGDRHDEALRARTRSLLNHSVLLKGRASAVP